MGSPECTPFSILLNLSKDKGDAATKEKLKDKYKEALDHLLFMIKIYQYQIKTGRIFVHEHPLSATSWQIDEMKALMATPGVHAVRGDQCMMGLKTWSDSGVEMAAKKSTRFLTNSGSMARTLDIRCDGSHPHQHLVGGRAKHAAEYPTGLCDRI